MWNILLGSAVAVAVVEATKEIVMWVLNRRAAKSDKKDEAESEEQKRFEYYNKRITEVEDQVKASTEILQKLSCDIIDLESSLGASHSSNRVILKDRIKVIALRHLRTGEISLEDKHNLNEMWKIYHYDLGGNGDLDDIMQMIDELQLSDLKEKD